MPGSSPFPSPSRLAEPLLPLLPFAYLRAFPHHARQQPLPLPPSPPPACETPLSVFPFAHLCALSCHAWQQPHAAIQHAGHHRDVDGKVLKRVHRHDVDVAHHL
eukprot:343279-Chlamydomonas_euryale.AAC.1